MEPNALIDLISSLGFPIVCVIALAWFCIHIIDKVLKDSKDREQKLTAEIIENRKVNEKAIETIARYAEKLDSIQKDVGEIKRDIIVIKSKEQ